MAVKAITGLLRLIILLALVALPASAWPERPTGLHFLDETYKIDPDRIAKLESVLNRLSMDHLCDVRYGMFESLQGRDLENSAYELVRDWEMGKGFGEGRYILLVAFLKDRKLRIEWGDAFDNTDLPRYTEDILDSVIRPRFKKKDYAGGFIEGITSVQRAIEGKYQMKSQGNTLKDDWGWWISVLIFVFSVLIGGGYYYGGYYGGSYFDGSSGGGFSGGGFGGGGYSGGGGGCSGSW